MSPVRLLVPFFLIALVLTGCSGSGGGGSIDADARPPGVPAFMTVTSTPAPALAGGALHVVGENPVALDIQVLDANHNPVADNTEVAVTVNGDVIGTVNTPLYTVDGWCHVEFRTNDVTGYGVLTFTAGDVTTNFTVEVKSLHRIRLTPQLSAISVNGQTPIALQLYDESEEAMPWSTEVQLASTGGSVPARVITGSNGYAVFYFYGGTLSGDYEITATVDAVTSEPCVITVEPATAGSISLVGKTPEILYLQPDAGSDLNAVLTFAVRDGFGNLVAPGTPVFFRLNDRLMGGDFPSWDEAIAAGDSVFATSAIGSTDDQGEVDLAFRGGEVPGVASVTATTDNDVATTAEITIVGLPVDERFSFSTADSYVSSASGTTLTVNLLDRLGHVVADGTEVHFVTECGSIEESGTSRSGQVQVLFGPCLDETNPLTGEVEPYGSAGQIRVLAWTLGEKAFLDHNGNGVYEPGIDVCQGSSEPFLDSNDSGSWEEGEYFIDDNGDGTFTAGRFLCGSEARKIWRSLNLAQSGELLPIDLQPALPSTLASGSSLTFSFNFADSTGQTLPPGTRYSISVDTAAAVLSGAILDYTVTSDSEAPETVSFSLLNNSSEAEAQTATVQVAVYSADNPDAPALEEAVSVILSGVEAVAGAE